MGRLPSTNEAPLHERLQGIELCLTHALGRLEGETAGEYPESLEHALLFFRQEVVAPRDRRAHGAMPLGCVVHTARE